MQCCVNYCGNDNKARKISKHRITFHTFPKDPNQRAAWIQSLSLTDLTPITPRTVVCSDHFLEEELYDTRHNTDRGRRTKVGAIPYIRKDVNAPITSRVCMICLALDAKMYHIKDYNLAQMYVNVIGIRPRSHAEGRLPQQVCWECKARLTSAAAFKAKAILSDSLLTEQTFKIGHILKIHQEHANLKSTLSRNHVQELFDTEHIDDLKSSSNTKTELVDIPFNDEFEVEVNQLLTDRIQIKDEKNNLTIEEITELDHNAVKTEVDLVPITEINIPEENYGFEDVHFSDGEATEEVCMETNDNTEATTIDLTLNEDIQSTSTENMYLNYFNINKHKVENVVEENIDHDDVIMVPDEDKFVVNNDTSTSVFTKHLQKDQIDFNSVYVNTIVSGEPKVRLDKTESEVKKENVAVKKTAVKKDASVVKKRRTKKKPYVKPCQPIDETVFTITALSQEAMIQEVLDREHSLKYEQAPFKCTICFRGFPTHDKQKRHMIKHSEVSGPIQCDICKVRVKKNRDLRSHMKQQHTEEFTCKVCPFVTRSRCVALGHVKFHAGSKYKCPQCDLEFEKQTTLLNHQRLKHVSDCVCELCGYTFVSTNGVRAHKTLRHKHVDKNVELEGPFCELCDVKFLSKSAYDRHLRLSSKHIKSENDPNRMSNDPSIKSRRIGFQMMKAVRRPVIHRRDENTVTSHKGPVTCEQCGLVLENLRAYACHFKSCHPGVNRTKFAPKSVPYMCEHCGKMFLNSTLLSGHMWVHTGEKRFQCEHCNKTFSMKSNLVGHMQLHVASSRRSYECRVCGKLFAFPFNLTRHMFLHTGLKPFKCDACDKAFPTSGELRAHVDYVHLKKPRPKRVRRKAKKVDMSSLEY